MFPKGILMICLGKRDWLRSRKGQNQKEVIIDHKCQCHCRSFMKVDQWHLVLEEERFVENARELEMQELNFMAVKLVMEQEKWKEQLQSKENQNKCKWNAINVKEVVNHQSLYALFVVGKKYSSNLEIYHFKLKREW